LAHATSIIGELRAGDALCHGYFATMHSVTTADPLFIAFQQVLTGRYSLDRELGRGGMGIVFLAREVHLDRLVAIKLLPPERARGAGLKERFLREARLAAKLSHPNIIPIHAVEEVGEFVFYVMAFVDGQTLAARVRERGPLPAGEGTRVLRETAWALAYAHEQGLVHRDVKPDNILLERATNRVLVADFGIASVAGAANDAVAGTPEFMSPEQALGKMLDARSDIYSLGATAFFAFSGRFPFEGATATEVLARQVTEQPPTLTSLGLTVPRKLVALVDRCLAKEPENRPASAQALAEQLSVAIEQRREMPAALRAFVKRLGRMNGGGTIIAAAALLPLSVQVSSYFGLAAGFGTLGLGVFGGPLAYFTWSARRLTRLGFSHRDLAPAFNAEIEQAQEELSLEGKRRASLVETLSKKLAQAAGTIAAMSFVALLLRELLPIGMTLYRGLRFIDVVFPFSISVASLATLGFMALRQRHQDIETEFWSKLWQGRIGRTAFSIARRLVGSRAPQTAMTHRATELSIGMAAEELYETLPKETRRTLGEVPALVTRLQADAQALRKRHDELHDVLASVGEASTSPEYMELRQLRDETHARLGDAVGSLETIRLNLLRLHAGSATVESVTTHLGLAAEVSEQVERLIQAHAEIDRHMTFPRRVAATPA
jgi:eukaryotic-like serine/threonine-protein kinase